MSDAVVLSERLLVVLLFLTATRAEASVAENRTFPPGFLFGCATASYQIEGAWNESGEWTLGTCSVVHSEFDVSSYSEVRRLRREGYRQLG